MKTENIKKYTKLVLALTAAGLIAGGTTYWMSSVKIQDARKSDVFKSVYKGKYLSEKVGRNILFLGQNYLDKETLNEAQFNKLMETKNELDEWLSAVSVEPEFKEDSIVLQEAWKDLSDQMNFLNNFYNSSIKSITNQTESMMVTRKNRAFLITENSDNLPNDVPYGAADTISNQKLEYNSPLRQSLRSQVEKTIASYITNSDAMNKALDKIVKTADSSDASLKAAALNSYLLISLVGFILISLSIMLLGSGGKNKKDAIAGDELFMILNNVKEGIFVMNPAWEVTGNISGSLGDLLNKELVIGDNFFTFLQASLDQKTANLAKDYLKLLIEKNLTEKLVASVNPLKLVNVGTHDHPHMVSINLSPIKGNGEIEKVLVTIFDASEQKKLEDTVKTEKTKSSNQFDFLLKIMQSKDQILYVQFFHKLQEVICDQNEKLKTAKTDEQSLRELLVEMQGQIHTLKAQAGILELGLYQQMLHDFETVIFDVKKKIPLKAEDMHTLSFFHKDFLEKTGGLISALEVALQNRLKGQTAEDAALSMGASLPDFAGIPDAVTTPVALPDSDSIPFFQGTSELNTGGLSLLDENMTQELGLGDMNMLDSLSSTVKPSDSLMGDLLVLVKNASEKSNKKVNLSLNLTTYDLISDEKRDSLRSILMHLVNNAVAHGIETVEEREKRNKYTSGVVQIFDDVQMDNFQEVVTIHVVDDGAGLNIEKIKARAIDLGMDIGDASPSKLIPLIFEPDFTTNEQEDFFSGRGIGLSFVKSEVEKLGGSINMKMRPGNYIEFSFKFNLNDF